MIKLFVLDLDGCVTHPFKTPHWESISKVRDYNLQSRIDPSIPGLSICTGRPYPYAEAVAQWLDIDLPIVFESGGGIYHPADQIISFSPYYDEYSQEVESLKTWADELVRDAYQDVLIEFTKKTDIGFVHNDHNKIQQILELAEQYVGSNYPMFEVHHTEVSVNVILSKCNKGHGLRWLSDVTGISLDNMAYIGDSSGDVSALKLVSKPFSPSNASSSASSVSKQLPFETSQAVLSAYEELIEYNRALIAIDS